MALGLAEFAEAQERTFFTGDSIDSIGWKTDLDWMRRRF
jgi:hypothetical protein